MSEQELDQALAEAQRQTEETMKIMAEHGFSYDFDVSKWLTVKRYAEQYGLSLQTVNTWIDEGVIPSDCFIDVPELDHIRLVKNQAY